MNPYLEPPTHCAPPPPDLDPYLEPELCSLPPGPDCAIDLEAGPDLECAVCFSQFNNVFRTPKMLQCRHTFCLECLARMNVKSSEPDRIQCPLCRGLTPLPSLGLPRLANDRTVLSYLPAAMQRVYSVRFSRQKGQLQVKRASEHHPHLARLGSVSQSLDVGLPSVPSGGPSSREGEQNRNLFQRLCVRPACRVILMSGVVLTIGLLTGITIFLLISGRV
ncbi:RING finger protein 223 [Hypomesus transpacificus]|uniref:RING finger protein 223 n=1 Tax=Hypomesus transpacificus TaxID=137520 RepID=UPI001F08517C|nr:RING finger protein 223 [Hypomesus transpacificus]XP_046904274.1 RING finger protein 223 [Hypomesus transpacificus]